MGMLLERWGRGTIAPCVEAPASLAWDTIAQEAKMKHEISVEKPSYVQSAWPGKYQLFSWLEYAVNIPYPAFLVTTFKENGKPNACFHSWGCFAGDQEGYCSVLVVLESFHTYENIRRSGEWCINLPSADQEQKCMLTIENNGLDNDEIVDSGLSVEPSWVVQAPRVAECLINLECRLEWDRPLLEGSKWHVFVGRIVHAAMDDAAFALQPGERLEALKTMYNLRSTLNPLTGEAGPASLPVLRPSP
jgi:flavin reductase (DIM6/NTAB) family NADH-FMN oxidoreductase RutF